MKKTFFISILACIIISSTATAQEAPNLSHKNTLYIHPVSLIVSTASPQLPTFFSLTFEKQISRQNALIINPNTMFWNISETLSINSFGSHAGIRHYMSSQKSNHGLYLQTLAAIDYLVLSDEGEIYNVITDTYTMDADLLSIKTLLYIGRKGIWDRICLFWDIGVGYRFVVGEIELGEIEALSAGVSLALDVNLGMGYAF